MRHKITSRLIRKFTLIFILFGVAVLVLFTSLFRQYIKQYHEEELLRRAKLIAQQFTYTFDELSDVRPDTETLRLDIFRRHIKDTEMDPDENLWLVSEDGPGIVMDHIPARFSTNEIMDSLKIPLEKIAKGEPFIGDVFSKYLNGSTVSVGVPIFSKGKVVGAAIFHNPITNLPPTLQKGKEMLLISLIVATLLAALVISVSARQFTKPIRKMNRVAIELAKGDYQIKTKVYQDDEIGQLAQNLDKLAEKLALSSEESAKLEKLRQDFIVNISHELRTPVTVIRGSLEALRDGVIPDETVPEYYNTLFNESVHLQRLVNDLLELSRLQNIDFDIRKEPLNLADVLEEVRRSMENVAKKKNIKIRLNLDIPGYAMDGDYVRLRQMLINLMDNAIKFSPEDSEILLRLWKEDDFIKMSVKDFGQGMNEEQINHIFDRFYKQDLNNPNGVGLGLSIVHEIARRHDFQLTVKAKEKKGSEFIFTRKE